MISDPDSSQQNLNRLRVAVSACLLGHKVRYDGMQKQHDFVAQTLRKCLDLIPVCPEVDIGMGVPRPPIHLCEKNGQLQAIGIANPSLDVTFKLQQYGQDIAQGMHELDGYIFKARSPSCGLDSTPINFGNGQYKTGDGLFAAQIKQNLPLLPVIEESGLESEAQQTNFIQRLFAYRAWRKFRLPQSDRMSLLQFHQYYRFLLMSHGAKELRRMDGWLKALDKGVNLSETQYQEYGRLYMSQFARQATRQRHAIVLQHILRLSRQSMDQEKYASLLGMIDTYKVYGLALSTVIEQLKIDLCEEIMLAPEVFNYLNEESLGLYKLNKINNIGNIYEL